MDLNEDLKLAQRLAWIDLTLSEKVTVRLYCKQLEKEKVSKQVFLLVNDIHKKHSNFSIDCKPVYVDE